MLDVYIAKFTQVCYFSIILLSVRGALKLIDFGIAKAIEREDTTNVYRETLSGTLSYMSPEAIMDTSTNAKGVRVNKCGRVSKKRGCDI
jgi:serine/threonine-protein kinase TTK/MPS1